MRLPIELQSIILYNFDLYSSFLYKAYLTCQLWRDILERITITPISLLIKSCKLKRYNFIKWILKHMIKNHKLLDYNDFWIHLYTDFTLYTIMSPYLTPNTNKLEILLNHACISNKYDNLPQDLQGYENMICYVLCKFASPENILWFEKNHNLDCKRLNINTFFKFNNISTFEWLIKTSRLVYHKKPDMYEYEFQFLKIMLKHDVNQREYWKNECLKQFRYRYNSIENIEAIKALSYIFQEIKDYTIAARFIFFACEQGNLSFLKKYISRCTDADYIRWFWTACNYNQIKIMVYLSQFISNCEICETFKVSYLCNIHKLTDTKCLNVLKCVFSIYSNFMNKYDASRFAEHLFMNSQVKSSHWIINHYEISNLQLDISRSMKCLYWNYDKIVYAYSCFSNTINPVLEFMTAIYFSDIKVAQFILNHIPKKEQQDLKDNILNCLLRKNYSYFSIPFIPPRGINMVVWLDNLYYFGKENVIIILKTIFERVRINESVIDAIKILISKYNIKYKDLQFYSLIEFVAQAPCDFIEWLYCRNALSSNTLMKIYEYVKNHNIHSILYWIEDHASTLKT